MPIEFVEVQAMTKDLAEMMLKIQKVQAELAKPIARMKELGNTKNKFGDEITDAQRQDMYDKAKIEHAKCKETYKDVWANITLPDRAIERPGQ